MLNLYKENTKGNVMIKKLILICLVIFLSGCTNAEYNTINRALHDSNVQMKRDMQENTRIQRCQNGYYTRNYGNSTHYRMCGGPYQQKVPTMPILLN